MQMKNDGRATEDFVLHLQAPGRQHKVVDFVVIGSSGGSKGFYNEMLTM